MPVLVTNRLAPASAGAINITGQAFVASRVGGDLTQAHLVRSIADFESLYSTRTGSAIPCWDWLDAFFREGGKQAWIGSYATAGDYAAAFGLFDAEKGPGQIAVVGEPNTAQLNADMANFANTGVTPFQRFAVCDVAQGSTLSAMEALGDALPSAPTAGQEVCALYGPWLNYNPPSGVVGGSARAIPASAAVCAVMARVDADGNPNRAPGGRDYILQAAQSVSLATSDTDRDTAIGHKVNLVRLVNSALQIDSAQTAVPQDPSTSFWQVNCSRARMWLQYNSWLIGLNYYMKNIDAEGHVAGALKKDLTALLMELYSADGLFGATPSDAFDVNVGTSVNTTATAANAELVAVAQARFSLYAKTVEIDLVAVPVAGVVVNS